MSTNYLPRKKIPYTEVRNLKLEGISIEKAEEPPRSLDEGCLLNDGRNCLWAYAATNGGTAFTRYGRNDVEAILEMLTEHFGTELLSEHSEDFLGLVDAEYRDDFVTIQLPTDDNPGPWKKVWPPDNIN